MNSMNRIIEHILSKIGFLPKHDIKVRSVKFLDFSVIKFTFNVDGENKFLILINDYKEHYKEYGRVNLLETNHTMNEVIAKDIILSNKKEWKDLKEF